MALVGSRHNPKSLADVIRLDAGAGQEDMFEPSADASTRGNIPASYLTPGPRCS